MPIYRREFSASGWLGIEAEGAANTSCPGKRSKLERRTMPKTNTKKFGSEEKPASKKCGKKKMFLERFYVSIPNRSDISVSVNYQ